MFFDIVIGFRLIVQSNHYARRFLFYYLSPVHFVLTASLIYVSIMCCGQWNEKHNVF